jgi:hypothetical protein
MTETDGKGEGVDLLLDELIDNRLAAIAAEDGLDASVIKRVKDAWLLFMRARRGDADAKQRLEDLKARLPGLEAILERVRVNAAERLRRRELARMLAGAYERRMSERKNALRANAEPAGQRDLVSTATLEYQRRMGTPAERQMSVRELLKMAAGW